MVLMASGGEFHDGNDSHWWDHKHPSFTNHTLSENTNWETVDVHMSVTKEAIIKATSRVNCPLEYWGCSSYPRYHAYRFRTYRNCPHKMEPDLAERVKRLIQEYTQRNSTMGGIRDSHGIQYERGQTPSTKTRSMFSDWRAQISK